MLCLQLGIYIPRALVVELSSRVEQLFVGLGGINPIKSLGHREVLTLHHQPDEVGGHALGHELELLSCNSHTLLKWFIAVCVQKAY